LLIVRKILILTLLTFTMLSCASVRHATPIAVEDIKEYPVSEEAEKKPAASEAKASADSEKTSAPKKEKPRKEEPQKEISLAQQVIDYARTFTGIPYKLGAAGPKQFDCSHFTTHVFKHFGYTLTPYTVKQFTEGREVASYSELKPGDLVFFGKRGSVRNIGHVGIVVSVNEENGSFNFIHASVSKGVTEDNSNHPYYLMRYIGARRVLPD